MNYTQQNIDLFDQFMEQVIYINCDRNQINFEGDVYPIIIFRKGTTPLQKLLIKIQSKKYKDWIFFEWESCENSEVKLHYVIL